mmetsp:Transcript_49092/g.118955  ORF Transcript_49092/g.118955 Transcript_49092/m.118955 type:complete len:245 (-) Transcript_49092:1890-2624(-)
MYVSIPPASSSSVTSSRDKRSRRVISIFDGTPGIHRQPKWRQRRSFCAYLYLFFRFVFVARSSNISLISSSASFRRSAGTGGKYAIVNTVLSLNVMTLQKHEYSDLFTSFHRDCSFRAFVMHSARFSSSSFFLSFGVNAVDALYRYNFMANIVPAVVEHRRTFPEPPCPTWQWTRVFFILLNRGTLLYVTPIDGNGSKLYVDSYSVRIPAQLFRTPPSAGMRQLASTFSDNSLQAVSKTKARAL